jgi:hypothetical protein
VCEPNLNKFLNLDETVIVPSSANGGRQKYSSGVNSLEYTEEVAPPGDFFDENGCETFGAELFVDTEKVDFRGVNDAKD